MNISKFQTALYLWKNIEDFPNFNTLSKKAKNYYRNSIRLVFIDKNYEIFYSCDMEFDNKEVHIEIYDFFRKYSNNPFIDLSGRTITLTKYNFNKKFAQTFSTERFEKWCYISDLYYFLINSIN